MKLPTLSNLLIRQLIACGRGSKNGKVFAPTPKFPLPLDVAIQEFLATVVSTPFTLDDFARWAHAQHPAVRAACITVGRNG